MRKDCHIVLFGECMIEMRGEIFGRMEQTFGGDTLNTAVYLARLMSDTPVSVSYATQLGRDAYSDAMVSAWQSEGVTTDLVRREEGKMPGLYTIQVDTEGERTFYYWRDVSAAKDYFVAGFTPLERHLDDIDMLYYSGISLAVQPAAGRERLLSVIRQLRARGGQVCFDNNFRSRLWRDDPHITDWYDRAYANADIAFVTLEDNMAVYGLDAEGALAHALKLPVPELAVKRGLLPAVVRVAGEAEVSVPTFPVAKVIDTTGAGDSFAAGYLAARLQDQSPVVAARSGNKLASIVVQHPGAIIPRTSMPVFFFG